MASAGLDTEKLNIVFKGRPDILAGIKRAADVPARVTLFNDIASFVHEQLSSPEPALKRRRVDVGSSNGPANGTAGNGAGGGSAVGNSAGDAAKDPLLLEIKDISFSIPQRKKFDLCFTKKFLYARASGTQGPVQGIVYAWKDIEHVFYLPVPDKAQQQYNYIVFPRNTALTSLSKASGPAEIEPLLFTVPSTAPKPDTISGTLSSTAAAVSDTYGSLLHWALITHLRSAGNKSASIVVSDPKIFHSMVRQSHRPNERAVHVKGFRGSKDGYLFFLPTGILWGFKKPLLFMPLERIVAMSYTSVLQRTFNVVVEVELSEGVEEEVEFAMLDQEDYGSIDDYVKRHGLQDRSMAERRKAKRELAENARDGKKKGEDGDDGEAQPDDGLTELQRAEQQFQDEEDEEEEDYDPGSEGDSDGEGDATSEEEEDGEGADEDDEDDEEEE